MMQFEKMAKNLISGPILARLPQIWPSQIFLWVLPLLHPRNCRKLSSHAISTKTYDPDSRK